MMGIIAHRAKQGGELENLYMDYGSVNPAYLTNETGVNKLS